MSSSYPDNRPNQAEQDPAASAFANLVDEYMEHHNRYPPGFIPNPFQSMIGSVIMERQPGNSGNSPHEIKLHKNVIDPDKMKEYPAGKTTRETFVIWPDDRFPNGRYDRYEMVDDGPIEHEQGYFATYREDAEPGAAPPRIVSDPAEIAQLAEWLAGMEPKALE